VRATQPGQSALLLVDVVEVIVREQFDYAVIGALALAIYGAMRASSDADALLQVPFQRLKHLRATLEAAGFSATLRRGEADDPVQGLLVVNDSFGNQVDLLGGLKGLDPQVFARTLQVPFAGQVLNFAGREDFIAMKCFAGGPQDLLDARSAYDGAQAPIDLDLLRTVTRRFSRDAADRLELILSP
jgi:hypothetical protein